MSTLCPSSNNLRAHTTMRAGRRRTTGPPGDGRPPGKAFSSRSESCRQRNLSRRRRASRGRSQSKLSRLRESWSTQKLRTEGRSPVDIVNSFASQTLRGKQHHDEKLRRLLSLYESAGAEAFRVSEGISCTEGIGLYPPAGRVR